ncbi:MAG: BRO-N domain-containing protein [Gammaproteobacteria bacterium]
MTVRVVADDHGDPWFCAPDVCAVLGYANDTDTIKKHCREGGVAKRYLTDSLGREQATTFIGEGNLYRLIIKSKKPEAEKFEA